MNQKLLDKYLFLFGSGGLLYILIELIWRGYSHWTMFALGGICFVFLGLINEILPWQTIDVGVSTNFLLREREKALRSESTPDCRTHCNGCGARRLSERGLCDESPAV